MSNKKKRTKAELPKASLAEYIRKHSPIKNGLRVDDEDIPLAKYNKITNRIYLGNFQSAEDKAFFKSKNIRAVLNCTRDIPNYFQNKGVEYMRIPVEDSLKDKDYELMYHYMPCIVEFINKHVNIEKNNILIHCWAGRQRSAIAVACFFVTNYNLTPHDACKLVMTKRPEAFHFGKSLNFDQALNRHYRTRLVKK